MEQEISRRLNWPALLGAVRIAAFLFCGAPEVWKTLRRYSFGPVSAYHSTDIYGAGLLGAQNVSEKTLRAFAELPQDRPVAVLFSAGDQGEGMLRYLVSYLSWPRKLQAIEVTLATAGRQLKAALHSSAAAVIFCGLQPPPELQPQTRIGAALFVVRLHGIDDAAQQ